MARGVGTAVWVERAALVAVGAGLYALLRGGVSSPDSSAQQSPRPEASPVRGLGELPGAVHPAGIATATDAIPARDVPTVPAVGQASVAAVGGSMPANPSLPPVLPQVDTDATSVPQEPDAPRLHARPKGDGPALPLTRMPGANQLRAGSKWDPKRGAWVLTRAYEVPAARAHVAAFYRKAIEDQGLVVTRVEGAPDTEGVAPLYLKGRSTGRHANITIRQDPEELRTRVRVIWRAYADAEPLPAVVPDDAEGGET